MDKARNILFAKLAMARFKACLREHGLQELQIIAAIGACEDNVAVKLAFIGQAAKWMAKARKARSAYATPAFRRSAGQLVDITKGPGAVGRAAVGAADWAAGMAKGFDPRQQVKALKMMPRTVARDIKQVASAPGKNKMKALGLGLGGAAVASEAHDAATRKRQKGEGFFESAGRRAGQLTGAAALFAPGAATSVASMFVPFEEAGGAAGKAIDTGIGAAREAGKSIRGALGGGKSYEAVKSKYKYQRPKAKGLKGQEHKVEGDY